MTQRYAPDQWDLTWEKMHNQAHDLNRKMYGFERFSSYEKIPDITRDYIESIMKKKLEDEPLESINDFFEMQHRVDKSV